MRRAAVLGRPVGHSLSPLLHRAAYRALGLDWTFEAIETGVGQLAERLADSGPEWAGFACTMPLKRATLELADTSSARARAVGAANTLVHGGTGTWAADNTDVDGIMAALAEHGVRPGAVTVLGAGGTAQAVVAALAEMGTPACSVLVRDPNRTAELCATAERAGVAVRLGALDDAAALDADLVISTLPAGAADRAVGGAGGTVVSGALMLLHQAVRQVELMSGTRPPVEPMREALRAALPGVA